MKHTELEDGDQLVTRIELRETVLSIHEDLLDIKKELVALHSEIGELRDTIRNKWWIALVVSAVTIIVAALIARHV